MLLLNSNREIIDISYINSKKSPPYITCILVHFTYFIIYQLYTLLLSQNVESEFLAFIKTECRNSNQKPTKISDQRR